MTIQDFEKTLSTKANKMVTYYYCEYDCYGQRTGIVLKNTCTELDFDLLKMSGSAVYLDEQLASRIALS